MVIFVAPLLVAQTASYREISGVYPHLAMYNEDNECGTGGVVPWADRLWVVTYSPHKPGGSADKLYEIDSALRQVIRPESVGGTPANRMIHRESNQLFIGPYAIDAQRNVRVIPYEKMYGRPTGNARHLKDPARKIYYASMEEGFFEVDVKTLAVTMLHEDANSLARRKVENDISGPLLPGYHGKGLYSGQGRLVYANNGEYGVGSKPPDVPSGCLAEWDGREWKVVRRNQFVEVAGPGGLYGNPEPETDPIWSTGWDHRSVILMLRDRGEWHSFRLPKAAHTYDGAHGWNTEWPRIRDIGERDMLMTMHGMFWRFPKTFSAANSAGIAPRSTYLRVIGDFARWGGRLVLGSDDTTKTEFFNTRNAKGKIPLPGQAHSNLWFIEPGRLDRLGVPIGRGGVWVDDPVKANQPSEPFLFSGFDRRMLHLTHDAGEEVTFSLEVDRDGNGRWSPLRPVKVPAKSYVPVVFGPEEKGTWIRIRANRDCPRATAFFHFANHDRRPAAAGAIFAGVSTPGEANSSRGYLWARGDNKRTLLFAAQRVTGGKTHDEALYEMDGALQLRRAEEPKTLEWMRQNFSPPRGVVVADDASVVYTDESGKRWRLPKGDPAFDRESGARIAREVSTERDLFNAHGTFYELPANNAGGIAMVRPVATHNRRIHDFCSYRGLLVISGVAAAGGSSRHIVRSDDGRAALWLGVSDDLWQFGKVRGEGGPWKDSQIQAGVPSEPYLMSGYDRKTVRLRHDGSNPVVFRVEVDITGGGLWRTYQTLRVPAGETVEHRFPEGFEAYWVRLAGGSDCRASATFTYE
jgi:hypothetical protein